MLEKQLDTIISYAAQRAGLDPEPRKYQFENYLTKGKNRLMTRPAIEFLEELERDNKFGIDPLFDIDSGAYYLVKNNKAVTITIGEVSKITKKLQETFGMEPYQQYIKIAGFNKNEPSGELVDLLMKSLPTTSTSMVVEGRNVYIYYNHDESINPLETDTVLDSYVEEIDSLEEEIDTEEIEPGSEEARMNYIRELTLHGTRNKKGDVTNRQLELIYAEERRTPQTPLDVWLSNVREKNPDYKVELSVHQPSFRKYEEESTVKGYVILTAHSGPQEELEGRKRREQKAIETVKNILEAKPGIQGELLQTEKGPIIRRRRKLSKLLRRKLSDPRQLKLCFEQ